MPGEKRINPQNPARKIRGRKQKKQVSGGDVKYVSKRTPNAAPSVDAGKDGGS